MKTGQLYPQGTVTHAYDTFTIVEDRVLGADATSTTFTGLDGDADEIYLLEGWAEFDGGVSADITFNSDTTANNYAYQRITASSTTASASIGSLPSLCAGSTGADRPAYGKAIIYAKTGMIRMINIQKTHYDSTGTVVDHIRLEQGVWNNTATNITQIVITGSSGGYIRAGSRFILSKKVS